MVITIINALSDYELIFNQTSVVLYCLYVDILVNFIILTEI